MTAELGCLKVYVCLFAEAENYAHIHVHLIPRAAGLLEERRGPGVFEYLREAQRVGNLGDVGEASRVATAVRARVAEEIRIAT